MRKFNRKEYDKEYSTTHRSTVRKASIKYRTSHREDTRKRRELYREAHKEALNASSRKYRETHKEEIKKRDKVYRESHREEIRKRMREYNRGYGKKRKGQDTSFRMLCYLRTRIWIALKGRVKSQRTIKLIGCSVDFLKEHLEKQFKKGMFWDNYGEWHVDHKRPCASFDLAKPKNQRKCFNWKNLQPLWANENIKKGAKVTK